MDLQWWLDTDHWRLTMQLAKNLHEGLQPPEAFYPETLALIKGDYMYYHFGCDGIDDRVRSVVDSLLLLNFDPCGM